MKETWEGTFNKTRIEQIVTEEECSLTESMLKEQRERFAGSVRLALFVLCLAAPMVSGSYLVGKYGKFYEGRWDGTDWFLGTLALWVPLVSLGFVITRLHGWLLQFRTHRVQNTEWVTSVYAMVITLELDATHLTWGEGEEKLVSRNPCEKPHEVYTAKEPGKDEPQQLALGEPFLTELSRAKDGCLSLTIREALKDGIRLVVSLDAMELGVVQDLPVIERQSVQFSATDQVTFFNAVVHLIETEGMPRLPALVPRVEVNSAS